VLVMYYCCWLCYWLS